MNGGIIILQADSTWKNKSKVQNKIFSHDASFTGELNLKFVENACT